MRTLFNSPKHASPLLIRGLVWPATVSIVLAAIAACGGSSTGTPDNDPSAGAGGAFHFGGASSTSAGRNSGTSGSSAGSATGGKPGAGGQPAMGGDSSSGPGDPGNGAAGEPGEPGEPKPGEPKPGEPKPGEPKPGEPKPGEPKPGEPKPGEPKPPLGMAGAGGEDEDCPLQPPADKAACTQAQLKCDYADIVCKCDGPENDGQWKCKQPPKAMSSCPPLQPVDASVCKTEDPPSAPCHYEEPSADCTCAADKWACSEAP